MNRTKFLVPVFMLATLGALTLPIRESAATGDAGAPLPACVQVTTSSRYVPYGYNHVVTLMNGCSRAVTCSVSTNVNPDQQTVAVPAKTKIDVMTFLGSASSVFTASVTCR